MSKKKLTKSHPPEHKTRLVRNQSSRNFGHIQAIAVHSTESQDLKGTRDDLDGIYNWFNNPSSQASSHLGVDGDGHIDVWVHRDRKAWTILQLNSVTWNIEFVGRAAQPRRDWEEHQIKRAAQFAAFICLKEGIPAQRGNVRNINGWPVITKKGIIRHKDLTDVGFGTHTDPGLKFPMRDFIDYVQHYKRRGWPAP